MPPGSVPPDDVEGTVRVLAAREPAPSEAARALAEQREIVARTHLVEAAGIPRDRLLADPGRPLGVEGDGRVEFTSQPSSVRTRAMLSARRQHVAHGAAASPR
jgi:hypothetical protein